MDFFFLLLQTFRKGPYSNNKNRCIKVKQYRKTPKSRKLNRKNDIPLAFKHDFFFPFFLAVLLADIVQILFAYASMFDHTNVVHIKLKCAKEPHILCSGTEKDLKLQTSFSDSVDSRLSPSSQTEPG